VDTSSEPVTSGPADASAGAPGGAPGGPLGGPPLTKPRVTWLGRLRARVRRTPLGRLLWRIGVTFAGVLVIAIGVVLLPLPGPGWLIIFAGLGILATEYTWAARLLGSVKRGLQWWRAWMMRRNKAVRWLLGLVFLVFLAGVILGCWYLYKVV
jgi:uncharacterized protein (TIGR02611 family)